MQIDLTNPHESEYKICSKCKLTRNAPTWNLYLIRAATLLTLLVLLMLTIQAQDQKKWKSLPCTNDETDKPETRFSISYWKTEEKDEKGNPLVHLRLRSKNKKAQTFHFNFLTDMRDEVIGVAEIALKLTPGTPQYTSLYSREIKSCSSVLVPEGVRMGFQTGVGMGNRKVEKIKPTLPSIKPPTIKPPTKTP